MKDKSQSKPLPSGRFRELNRSKSVFINCPFDSTYAELFEAIVFTTVCCGFMPRSALESGTVSEPRVNRICDAIFGSAYSIHDLSRCTGEGHENFARFNMPLELGIAMASRFIGGNKKHDWLVLVPDGHAYLKFLSDLAAYDPAKYDGSVEGIVAAVAAWLTTRSVSVALVNPASILAALPKFRQSRRDLQMRWKGVEPWYEIVLAAIQVAQAAL